MNHPARDPLAEVSWIGKNKFDFVDLTLEPPAADPDKLQLEDIQSALERYNLGVVTHSAWFIPLASPFATIREATLQEYRRCLKTAHGLGARILNVHAGKLPPHFTMNDAINWHVETLAPLCEEASRLGVTIVLEHVPFWGPNQLEVLLAIMEKVPPLGFHLDSGHAKLERGYDRFSEYLKFLGHRLRHVHLSENDGSSDQHLPPGSVSRNATDWPGHIRELKATGYDGTITLEVFSQLREHLLWSRDRLRKWWEEA